MSNSFNSYGETCRNWEKFHNRICLHFATNVSIKGHHQRDFKTYTIDCIVLGGFLMEGEEVLEKRKELAKYRLVLSQALVEIDHWEMVIQVAEKTITAKVYSPIDTNTSFQTFLIALSKLEEGSYVIKNTKSGTMVAIQEIYTNLY